MLYLIHGENQYASLKRLSELERGFVDAYVVIDGRTITDVAEIFSATDTFSMFTQKQLTIVKRFSANPKKLSLEKRLVSKLQEMDINSLDLVFWEEKNLSARSYSYKKKKPVKAAAPAKKTTATTSLAKFLNERAQVETYPALSENELNNWIVAKLSRLGVKNGNRFSRLIIEKAGIDQMILSSEIKKLALYIKSCGRETMEPGDLAVITLYEQTTMIWELTDAICNRNKAKALNLLEGMLKGPEDYPLIFAASLKQIRNIFIAKKFASQKDRLMTVLKLTPYTFTKLLRFAAGFSEAQIQTLYSKMVNLDYTVKQGKIEVKLGLDLLVATL